MTMTALASHPPLDAPVLLVPALRASLQAKLQRQLARSLIARIDGPTPDASTTPAPSFLAAVRATVQRPAQVAQRDAWVVPPDGVGCDVAIAIDYEDRWRDEERHVLDVFKSAVEELVVWLTTEQHALLVRSPREFLELTPRPETSELYDYAVRPSGGRNRTTRWPRSCERRIAPSTATSRCGCSRSAGSRSPAPRRGAGPCW